MEIPSQYNSTTEGIIIFINKLFYPHVTFSLLPFCIVILGRLVSPNNWYLQVANPAWAMQGANLNTYVVDFDYFERYGICLAAGRSFSRDFLADSTKAMILNEADARSLGYADPAKAVGRKFSEWGVDGNFIGIAKDFHFRSLQEQIQALTFMILSPFLL